MTFKPLLSGKAPDLSKLSYPVICSPKLDGIRAVKMNGQLLSRTLKPIPNHHVQKTLSVYMDGYDGELVSGDVTDPLVFNKTSSAIMSRDGEPEFTYYVFDWLVHPEWSFTDRLKLLQTLEFPPHIKVVPHKLCENPSQVEDYEEDCLAQGYEGIMIRDPNGKYKYGRSTTKEGILLKLKRFEDAEAEIIDVLELMHNDNEAQVDNLGHTKRSSSKEGKIPAGTLGKLVVKSPEFSETFEIGVFLGLKAQDKLTIWQNKELYIGKQVVYKYQTHGTKDRPRLPVFKGFRDD